MKKSVAHCLMTVMLSGLSFPSLAVDGCQGSRGEIAVCHLNLAYHNQTDWCGHHAGENRHAALCSGILLRGITSPQKRGPYHAWDIRPTYAGVSFSFLRKDQQFGRLAYSYQAGIIVNPYDHTPAGKTRVEMKCAFPFDGDSVNRRDFCGQDRDYTESNPCYSLTPKVTTPASWREHFEQYKGKPESGMHACGFMLDGPDAREQLRVSMQSRNEYLAHHPEAFDSENEVVLKPWNPRMPKQIPLEAFFYLQGSSEGLDSARSDQQEFYDATDHQERVPIIQLQLPTSNTGEAHFSFHTADQKIP